MVNTLQERAVDAVNRIVALIRRMNDQRFRRLDRQTDLRILARWFEAAESRAEVVALWRTGFGVYSARHIGNPHPLEDDQDLRPSTSWWEGNAVEIPARLRKHGPRARTGRPARVSDPSAAKKLLRAMRQAEESAANDAAATLAERCPTTLSRLGPLSAAEFVVLIRCLDIALASQRRRDGSRRAVSSDGQLKVVLADPPEANMWTIVETDHGRLRLQNFILSLEVFGAAQ